MPNKRLKDVEKSTIFATLFTEAKKRDEYYVAGAKIEVAEQIYRMMEARNVSQSDLARRLGKHRAYISKILQGTSNCTVETLVLIARKLDAEWTLELVDAQKSKRSVYYTGAQEWGGQRWQPEGNMSKAANDPCEEIGWQKVASGRR